MNVSVPKLVCLQTLHLSICKNFWKKKIKKYTGNYLENNPKKPEIKFIKVVQVKL